MDYSQVFHQYRIAIWDMTYNHYLTSELLTPAWWGIVAMLVAFYAVWLRLLDKTRVLEILLFGSFVSVAAAFIDIAGTTAALWHYDVRLFPILPAPFPFDFTVAPILLMLVHQYSDSWARYSLWNIIASAIAGLGITPLFVYLGIKTMYVSSFYHFILTFVVGMVARWIILWVMRVQESSRPKAVHSSIPTVAVQPAFKPRRDDDN